MTHNLKKTPVRKAFGLLVREFRFKLDITQDQLAERCGLHQTYIGSVERGERNVSLENIITIAKGLDCSPKDLMPDYRTSAHAS